MPDRMPAKTTAVFAYLKQCAAQAHTVTYGEVGDQVGLIARGTANPLYYIRDECLKRSFPPLTALVVRKQDGLPGTGLKPNLTKVTTEEWHEMRSQVFAFDWSAINLENSD